MISTQAAADRDEPHPGDSVNLDDWHAAFATLDFVEAKYLVLRRDPVRAAWSHREWDGSFGRHAESNAALARYVCDFLREPRLCDACARRPLSPLCDACAAPAKDWRWLDYEDLVAAHYSGDATGLVGRLAAFARVDAADLEDALTCFAPSSKTPDVAPRLAATVDLAARTAEAPSPYAPERHV